MGLQERWWLLSLHTSSAEATAHTRDPVPWVFVLRSCLREDRKVRREGGLPCQAVLLSTLPTSCHWQSNTPFSFLPLLPGFL